MKHFYRFEMVCLALVIAGIAFGLTEFPAETATEPKRFEQVYEQRSPGFEVYRDTKTGTEIACRYGGIVTGSYVCVALPIK